MQKHQVGVWAVCKWSMLLTTHLLGQGAVQISCRRFQRSKPQPPQQGKNMTKIWPPNCRICRVLKHLASHVVQIFVPILPCRGAGVTSVFLNLGGNHQEFNGAVTPILKQTSCYLATFLEDVRCPALSQPFRTHHGLDRNGIA